MNTTFANVRLKGGNIVTEKEFDVEQIKFDNGSLVIGETKYSILILGDDENKPTGFIKDAGDGYPRVLTVWRGVENQWMLDDVILDEI